MSDESLQQVYKLAQQLDTADRQRLVEQLLRDSSPRLSLDDLLDSLNAHTGTLRQLGVEKIGVFGSHVRGEANPFSDIDILVRLSDHTFDTYTDVKFYLEDLLNCEVDLVLEDTLKPGIKPYVLSEVRYAENV